jgi:transposase-like protein
MSKRIFDEAQLTTLRSNKNVSRCSDRSISYSKEFKLAAVKRYNEEGLTSREIFKQAGFDLNTVGRDTPKSCLKRWNKTFRAKGLPGLQKETRGRNGGRPKKQKLTEEERMEWLEAEVAYLRAENDFLIELRAKRAEQNSGRKKNTG